MKLSATLKVQDNITGMELLFLDVMLILNSSRRANY